MIIEGNISVKAAVSNNKRDIIEIIVDENKKDKDTNYILNLASNKSIAIRYTSREEIDNIASGKTHGGLIAEVKERRYETLENIININNPFLAIVEGVEDPFNLGYIMRSLYSAGCDALILKKRNWGDSESVILKSSAGAFEWMNVVMSRDLKEDVLKLKNKNIKVYAAYRNDATEYTEADLKRPLLVVVGGEMRGISREILDVIDEKIYIPYENDFRNALNAAASVAVIGFEVMRQNKKS